MSPASPSEPSEVPGSRGVARPNTGRVPWRFRWARRIASGNVFGLGVGAVLSLAVELPSLSWIGVALAVLAWNEWRGRALLLAADTRAPRRLALNQLFTFVVVAVYCAVAAYATWTGPSPLDAALLAQPELGDALGGGGAGFDELNDWGRRAALAVYGALVVSSCIVQGLAAALYLSLRRAPARPA